MHNVNHDTTKAGTTMQITLTIDTSLLSSDQVRALGVLVGTEIDDAVQEQKDAPKAAPAAKKAAAAPKPDPEPAEDDAPTLEDAVALATKMVSNGEAKKVKAALSDVGAKKVSEIPEGKVSEFVAALS